MKYWNKFDILLLLLISSLAFGMVGGALSLPRALAIIFLPFFISIIPCVSLRKYDILFFFLAFWVIYGIISLCWTSDRSEGAAEVIYFFVHFLLFVEIIGFSLFAKQPLKSICMGWLCAFLLTSFVGVWELVTDSHLYMSKQHSELYYNSGIEILQRRFASVTFGNYNGYVTFICFSFPFILYLTSYTDKIVKYLSIIAICLSFIFILYNASRGGFVSLCGMLFVYVLATNKFDMKLFISLLLCSLIVFYLKIETDLFDVMLIRSERTAGLDDSRVVLWGNVINLWASSAFIGTGIGGMIESMKSFSTNRLLITHNLFFEILVQFGFVIFVPFILYLVFLLRKIARIQEKNRKWLLISLMCLMPFYVVIHSGYLLFPPTFAFFASMQVLIDYEYT